MDNPNRPILLEEVQDETRENTLYVDCMHCLGSVIGTCSVFLPCINCLFCIEYPYQQVDQGSVILKSQFGAYEATLGPGMHYINPCTEKFERFNTKLQNMKLAQQQVITKDFLSIQIGAHIHYRIVNAKRAKYQTSNFEQAISFLSYSALKNVAGQHVFQDLLEKREQIANMIEDSMKECVFQWGIQIANVLIVDIQLDAETSKALSTSARGKKLAQSKVISSEADVKCATMMKEASEALNSKTAMEIRYLEVVNNIAKSGNTKVIFLPLDDVEDMK